MEEYCGMKCLLIDILGEYSIIHLKRHVSIFGKSTTHSVINFEQIKKI